MVEVGRIRATRVRVGRIRGFIGARHGREGEAEAV